MTNILPSGQLQFLEPAFSGQNWGSNGLVPDLQLAEALDCPRRRETLVHVPKGRSKLMSHKSAPGSAQCAAKVA